MMNHTNQDDLHLFDKLKKNHLKQKREDLKLSNVDWQEKKLLKTSIRKYVFVNALCFEREG